MFNQEGDMLFRNEGIVRWWRQHFRQTDSEEDLPPVLAEVDEEGNKLFSSEVPGVDDI